MLLLLLLLTFNSDAQTSLELVGGSLTYHVMNPGDSNQFANRLSPDGRLIRNPIIGVQEIHELDGEYWSLGAFAGQNSVGDDIMGFKVSRGKRIGNWYLGLVAGAYEQSSEGFYDKGMVPFQIAKVGDVGVVPLLGIEANYRVNLSQKYYLKLNNLISPVITNTTISLGISF